MIVVQKTKKRKDGQCETTYFYYLSNQEVNSARYFAEVIRGHWGIENKLHWVKDVQMNEDKSRIRHRNGAAVLSVLFSFSLNLTRSKGYTKWKEVITKFSNRVGRIMELI